MKNLLKFAFRNYYRNHLENLLFFTQFFTFQDLPSCSYVSCADSENFLRGVQIPRRGLTENFNMAKINNLAIPGVGSGPPVPPPLDPPMCLRSQSVGEAKTEAT